MLRLFRSTLILLTTVLAAASAAAQNRVQTETIRPPARPAPITQAPAQPEIIADLSRLPVPVARMRERILTAARSGDLQKVVAVMQSNATMPLFSLSNETDVAALWRNSYPDSDGVEALSILATLLEMAYLHLERGTPQEMYVWPYLARLPLKTLTPPQKVDLFRLMTGSDYKDMLDVDAYQFYRLGIGPDGTWHFFVAGD